jgi:twitching motility protein PilT
MAATPSITADALLDRLSNDGILDELGIISLLGPARHALNLKRLETALIDHKIMSPEKLAEYKQELSGIRTYLPADVNVTAQLPERVATKHGALLTDRTTPKPLVLFVEDTDTNVEGIRTMAGGMDFEVGLITVPHFLDLFRATYKGIEYSDRPVAQTIFDILDITVEADATDLHLRTGIPPRARIDGVIKELNFRPLDMTWMNEQIAKFTEERHILDLKEKFSTDLAYSYGPARFRVNIAHDRQGPTMALRLLPSKIPTPEQINLPQGIRDLAHLERGLVLVTGPTGSGKSTTLASLLYEIINTSDRHVITLEDPIEFTLPTHLGSLVNQRELGSSFDTFAGGLRDALRQDPDVVLVGEMRDAETIATAITAAETGHLVLGTLHTYDAPSTIMRVVNTFPTGEQDAVRSQLSQLLKAIVSQTLLPRASGKGRVAAFEVLLNNTAVASGLRKVDGHSSLKQTMQTGISDGMQTMEMALALLAIRGQVTEAEARFRTRDESEFDRYLRYYRTSAPQA